jgi:hypothetical protein
MTTKPRLIPRPLRGGSDFSVRVDGQLATMHDGRTAALLSEEEAWAKFRVEWATPLRRVELLRGALVVAEVKSA